MVFDIPHMIATAAILLAVIWVVDHARAFETAPRGRKTLFKFGGIFILILILNLVWPYGSTA